MRERWRRASACSTRVVPTRSGATRARAPSAISAGIPRCVDCSASIAGPCSPGRRARRAMQRPDDAGRAAVVALHDVSPATWRECRLLLERLDAAGVRPVTLLIVPDFHHRAPVGGDPAFLRAMDARLAPRDQVVLPRPF